MKGKKISKTYSEYFIPSIKFALKLFGRMLSHTSVWVKKSLAQVSRHFTFNDTLSRWNYLLMEEVFCQSTKPIFLIKKNFRVFDSKIKYRMKLNLSDDLQRAYYFLNYGQDLLKVIKDNLKKDSVFIDAGANIGYFSMLASTIIKDGRILSFEPASQNYKGLVNNTKQSIIKTFRIGLSDRKGYARLYNDLGSSGWHSLKGAGRYEKIKIARLDDLKLNLIRIDLIKIDVERHELEVLRGMKKTILRFHPLVFCEVDSETEKNVVKFMSRIGYSGRKFEGTKTYDILFMKNETK